MAMSVSEALETLGLGPRAGPQDVRKAFRQLSKRFHPDVVAGLSAKAKAQQRFLKIRDAHEMLMKNPHLLRRAPVAGRRGKRRGGEYDELIQRYRAEHVAKPSIIFQVLARWLSERTLPERVMTAVSVIVLYVILISVLMNFTR